MKSKNLPILIGLLLAIVCANLSCKKERRTFESFNLQVEVIDGKYYCNWTEMDHPEFARYIFVSAVTILEGAESQNDLIEPFEWQSFSSDTITSFDFEISGIIPRVEIQVWAIVGDRIIYSNKVEIVKPYTFDLSEIQKRFVGHHPELHLLYFSDFSEQTLTSFNYETEEINTIDFQYELDTDFVIGNNGKGEEIYVAMDEDFLGILDAQTLELKETIDLGNAIFDITTNNSGLIALTSAKSTPVVVIKREDLTIASALGQYAGNAFKGIAFISKEKNELVEVQYDSLHIYHLNEDGTLSHSEERGRTSVSNPFYNYYPPVVSPSEEYFIISAEGIIMDSAYTNLAHLTPDSGYRYKNFLFDETTNSLYAGLGISINDTRTIHKYSIPNFELENSYSNFFYKPDYFFQHNNYFLVLGRHKDDGEFLLMTFEDFFDY